MNWYRERNLKTPQTIEYENWIPEENSRSPVVDVLELVNQLRKYQKLAVAKITENQEKRKLWCDRNAVIRKFKVGELVSVLVIPKPHKMGVIWIEPGKVTSVISDTNYTVDYRETK